MSRCVYLALLAVLVALVFAPAAVAQQMDDHQMSASPTSSASATASPSSTSSAMSASPSATATSLPRTGGISLLPLLSAAALALIAGSGIVAATIARRNS